MNLIILFGPPAVGKLTVGKQLSKLTGYSLLHNHLTVDLIKQIFPFGSKPFSRLNRQFRKTLVRFALTEKLPGLIMTYVWASNLKPDNDFLQELVDLVRKNNGHTYLIGLACPYPILLKRVVNQDRRVYGKLHRASDLQKLLPRWKMQGDIRRKPRPTLVIDTSRLKPIMAAELIVKRCRTKRAKQQ